MDSWKDERKMTKIMKNKKKQKHDDNEHEEEYK